MRARAAYIRSLGTTSILVAAALLMLGVVGALVGFHGWPAGAVGETVPAVPLTPTPQPVLSAVRDVRKTDAVTRVANTPRRASTAGLVKVVPVSTPHTVGTPEVFTPGHTGPASGAPPAAAAPPEAADHGTTPVAQVSPPAQPPTDPEGLQTLLTQLGDQLPPPPSAPHDGQGTEVSVPLLGVTITVPPGHAQ
jgi:hypothetical protein